jgi:hypothetical protein
MDTFWDDTSLFDTSLLTSVELSGLGTTTASPHDLFDPFPGWDTLAAPAPSLAGPLLDDDEPLYVNPKQCASLI